MVYTAGTLSLAMLEIIVHLEFKEALKQYRAIPVEVQESTILSVDLGGLPEGWNAAVPQPSTQLLGNRWLTEQASAVLKVPSVIVPVEYNYLLNPVHPAWGEMKFGKPVDLPLDPRVMEKLR